MGSIKFNQLIRNARRAAMNARAIIEFEAKGVNANDVEGLDSFVNDIFNANVNGYSGTITLGEYSLEFDKGLLINVTSNAE